MKCNKSNFTIKIIFFILFDPLNIHQKAEIQAKNNQEFNAINLKKIKKIKEDQLSKIFQNIEYNEYPRYEESIKKYSYNLAILNLFLKIASIETNKEERISLLGKNYANIYDMSTMNISMIQYSLNAAIEEENSITIELLNSIVDIINRRLHKETFLVAINIFLIDMAEFALKKTSRNLIKKYCKKRMIRRIIRAMLDSVICSTTNNMMKKCNDVHSTFIGYFIFNILTEIYGEIIIKIINKTSMQDDVIVF